MLSQSYRGLEGVANLAAVPSPVLVFIVVVKGELGDFRLLDLELFVVLSVPRLNPVPVLLEDL